MSSGKQEASPAQQRAEIEKLAAREGCNIIRWYTDEKISGDATEKRKDFQRMIADAEELGDFTAILCWDQDRFGRFDSIEAGRWIHPLRQAGVCLVTVAQGHIDWNDFAGRMMYNIQQEGKHQFLIDLSRNVLRGRIASAKAGRMIVTPPYGYDRVFFDATGKLVKRVPYGEKFSRPKDWTVRLAPTENAVEIETVRWLFRTFADTDCSVHYLVLELNRRNVPTRRGQGWSPVSVRFLLTHRVYAGDLVFGRRKIGKYHQMDGDGDVTRSNGTATRQPPIIVPDAHEALIDRETFDRVQAKLKERRAKKAKPRYNGYILTGVVRCGHCGRPMCGKPGGCKSEPTRRYYYCPGGATGRCKTHSIHQGRLDSYVLGFIDKTLRAPGSVEKIKAAIHRKVKEADGFQGTTKALRAQLDAMDKKIGKGTENLLLANPDDMGDLSALLSEWRGERNRLQSELEALTSNPTGDSPDEKAKRAIRELNRLRKHLETADPLRVRAVVKAMVDKIELFWQPDGKRYRTLAKGVMTLRSNREVLESSNSSALQNLVAVFGHEDLYPEKRQYEKAAEIVAQHTNGKPVRTRVVADRLGIGSGNVTRALRLAERDGLVVRVGRSEWTPPPKAAHSANRPSPSCLRTTQ